MELRINCVRIYCAQPVPPTTKLGQGNIFTGVCDSVYRGSASVHAGIPPPTPSPRTRQAPPGPGTPPGTRHPKDQTPCNQAPPQDQTLPPPRPGIPLGAEHTGRYGQRAGGMHPTGMQSCYKRCLLLETKKNKKKLPNTFFFSIFLRLETGAPLRNLKLLGVHDEITAKVKTKGDH